MKKYKLLYFVSEDQYFFTHKKDQAISALKNNFDVLVICKFTNLEKKIRSLGFKTKNLNFNRGSINPFAEVIRIVQFAFIILKFKPDIIQSIALKPILYTSIISLFFRKTKFILCIVGLGYLFIDKKKTTKIIKSAYLFLISFFLLRKNTIFVFQNQEDKRQIENFGLTKKTKYSIIRGSGVDTKKFVKKNIEKKYDLIFHSRILNDKGFLELVDAIKYIKKKKSLNVLVLGDPDEKNRSFIKIKKLKEWQDEKLFTWKKKQQNVLPFLQISKLAVLPSYREGLPKTLLEAASSELPIVASNVPGCKEICIHKYNGLLVPPKNSILLAKAIEKILSNPSLAKKYGKNGRKLVLKSFSTDLINKEFLTLYKKIL